ncbi:MAG: hypothetical protein R2705_07375 [Ilumatobacteraceae bacterium]
MAGLADLGPTPLVGGGGASVATTLAIGLPTDLIPNPVFGRSIPPTWWSWPVLAITAVLTGLLFGTYVRVPAPASAIAEPPDEESWDRPARTGGLGGLLSFFAVGCPVCNKIVLLALGSVGARRWFEPIQPYLAAVSIVLLVVALRARLRGSLACPVRPAL